MSSNNRLPEPDVEPLPCVPSNVGLSAKLLRPENGGAEDSYLHLTVAPPAEHAEQRPKQHLVFVVDVSYSMQDAVESVADGGKKESHGFTILDLVKHSLLTIVEALDPELHSVSIVSFSDDARVDLKNAKLGGAAEKKVITDAIKKLTERGGTNLWSGLKQAYAMLNTLHNERVNAGLSVAETNEVMLFTDGQPNNIPPKGHIPTLQEFVKTSVRKEVVAKTNTRTYGFGYNLNAKLLEEIALTLDGTYSFIPDAGFVGTVFIHAMADLLSALSLRDVKLEFEFEVLNADFLTDALRLTPGNVTSVLATKKSHLQGSFLGYGTRGQSSRLSFDMESEDVCPRDPLFSLPEYALRSDGRIFGKIELRLPGAIQVGQNRDIVLKSPIIDHLTPAPQDACDANLLKHCVFEKLVNVNLCAVDVMSGHTVSKTLRFPHSENSESDAFSGQSGVMKLNAGSLNEIFRLDLADKLHSLVRPIGGEFGADPPGHCYGHKPVADDAIAGKAKALALFIEEYEEKYELSTDPDPDDGFLSPSHNGWVAAGDEETAASDEGSDSCAAATPKRVVYGSVGEKKRFAALMTDLTGQATEACSKGEWFRKWGEYYIRSLVFAHYYQKKNNFKDPGVQSYGGKMFKTEVNRVNDLFDNLEPPKPSSNRHSYSGGYGASARGAPALLSMSAYNNSYGPCFGGDSVVTMRDGSKKSVRHICEGDHVRTDGVRGWNKVVKVIETRYLDEREDTDNPLLARKIAAKELPKMPIVRFNESGLTITPWHPVFVGKKNAIEALRERRRLNSNGNSNLQTAISDESALSGSTAASSSAAVPNSSASGAMLMNKWQFPMDLYTNAQDQIHELEVEIQQIKRAIAAKSVSDSGNFSDAVDNTCSEDFAAISHAENQIKFLRNSYSLHTVDVVYNFILENANEQTGAIKSASNEQSEEESLDAEVESVSKKESLTGVSNRPSALMRGKEFFLNNDDGGYEDSDLEMRELFVKDIDNKQYLPQDPVELRKKRDAKQIIDELQGKSPVRAKKVAPRDVSAERLSALAAKASKMTNSSNEEEGEVTGSAGVGHSNRSLTSTNDMCIFVNNVRTCTLGHGLEGEVIAHPFFGNYSRVERDLKRTEQWNVAFKNIVLDAHNCLIKDPITRLVDGLYQRSSVENGESEKGDDDGTATVNSETGAGANSAGTASNAAARLSNVSSSAGAQRGASKNLGSTTISESGKVSISCRNDSKVQRESLINGTDPVVGTGLGTKPLIALPKMITATTDNTSRNSRKRRKGASGENSFENQPSPRLSGGEMSGTNNRMSSNSTLGLDDDEFCVEVAPAASSDNVRPGNALLQKSFMGRGGGRRKRGFGGIHGKACGCCEGKMRNQKALAAQMRGMENM